MKKNVAVKIVFNVHLSDKGKMTVIQLNAYLKSVVPDCHKLLLQEGKLLEKIDGPFVNCAVFVMI